MKPDELRAWASRYPWFEKQTPAQQKATLALISELSPEVFVGMRYVHKLMAKRVYTPMLRHLDQRTELKPQLKKLLAKEFA